METTVGPVGMLAAEIESLRSEVADAARCIHDLRQESAAYDEGRADALGEVVRMLEREQERWRYDHQPIDARGALTFLLSKIRALGTAAPPRAPDVLREENERLWGLLSGLAEAAKEYGMVKEYATHAAVSNRQHAAFWNTLTAALQECGRVEYGSSPG